MTTKPQDQQDQGPKLDVGGLWSVMNIYECNFWFLGVDQASEVTESFREQDGRNMGESFSVEVKVWASVHCFYWWTAEGGAGSCVLPAPSDFANCV